MRFRISRKCDSLTTETLEMVERRMRFSLTRFSTAIGEVSVSLIDESGPHGAPTKKCSIVLSLGSSTPLIAEAVAESYSAAVSQAADRMQRTVARQLQRRRDAKKYQRRRSQRTRAAWEATGDSESQVLQ